MPDPKQTPQPGVLFKLGANVDALWDMIEAASRDPKKAAALDVERARRHAIRILELLG